MILQRYYGLGDTQIEYQILDRLSFKKFLRLDSGQDFFVDSAYTGKEREKVINKYEMIDKIHEKGYRNKPLIDEQ